MTEQDIVQWFGFCAVMHGIFGVVLGLVATRGLLYNPSWDLRST